MTGHFDFVTGGQISQQHSRKKPKRLSEAAIIELRSADHPIHRDLIEFPPPGINYVVDSSLYGDSRETFRVSPRQVVRRIASSKHFVYGFAYSLNYLLRRKAAPKLHSSDVPLVHSFNGLVYDKRRWILELEHGSALFDYSRSLLSSPIQRHIVRTILADNWCRHILPWSRAAHTSLVNAVGPCIEEKTTVLYPATVPRRSPPEPKGPLTILFVGRDPILKGLRELLRAYEVLSRKYDIELLAVSEVSPEMKRKYNHLPVTFVPFRQPRETLFERYFARAHLFVLPTLIDNFGISFIEAMSFGMPLVGLRTYSAVPEIIQDGTNGFLIDSKVHFYNSLYLPGYFPRELHDILKAYVQEEVSSSIVEKTAELIEDSSLRRRMAINSWREVAFGKFSVTRRNTHLCKIYETS